LSGKRAKALRRAAVAAKPAEPSWHEQRVIWNKAGQCARVACRAPLAPAFRHPDTRLLYCAKCACLIQDMNPGLVLEEVAV
jgi:hypothetical protein